MTTKKVNPSYTDQVSYQTSPESKHNNIELDQMDEEAEDRKATKNLDGKITGYLALCLLTAAIGSAFQFGWSTAIFNTPEKVIQEFYNDVTVGRLDRNLTSSEMTLLWSVTSGMQPFGGIIGGFSSGFMADYFGRKKSLLLTNVFVAITTIFLVISKFVKSYETIMVGRFFAGVICGLFSGLFPMYLNECSPVNLRGRIGVINQFSVVVGIFVVNVFGLSEILGTEELWPVLCAFTILPSLAHIALFFTAESPKYVFMARNNEPEARKLLLKLRANDQRLVSDEIDEMKDERARMAEQEKVTWGDMFKRVELRRPLIVTVVIQMSQQFSGINAVIFFSTQIFVDAGLDWGTYATLLMSGMQIVMTFVCMLIIDKAGRKPLLLTGMIGMSVTCFGLVLTLVFKDEADWLSYITVVCVVLYIVFFSIGPGPIPWLLTGELFESDSRGKATSIAVLVNWTSNFIVVVTFNFLKDGIGDYSFIVYGSLLVGFGVFTLFFVPETKGKSTEDVVTTFKQKFIFFPK